MNKQEYLNIKFKGDFLRYSLLQEESDSAKDIANKLFKSIDLEEFIRMGKREIAALLVNRLSFDVIKVDGKVSNKLPAWLDISVKNELLADFQKYLNEYDVKSVCQDNVDKVVQCIEMQAWSNGVAEISNAIKLLTQKLNKVARDCDKLLLKEISDDVVAEKYSDAKTITLIERIDGSNVEDIIEYRNALQEYVSVKCENMLYVALKEIYFSIAGNEIFSKLQENFDKIHKYAIDLKNILPELTPNVEWDVAYNRQIPTDFYRRNVDNITSEQAFHMILLHFFAQNEQWMIEQGLLVDGELCVYTNVNSRSVETLVSKLTDL